MRTFFVFMLAIASAVSCAPKPSTVPFHQGMTLGAGQTAVLVIDGGSRPTPSSELIISAGLSYERGTVTVPGSLTVPGDLVVGGNLKVGGVIRVNGRILKATR